MKTKPVILTCMLALTAPLVAVYAQVTIISPKKEPTAEQMLRLQKVRSVEQWVRGARDAKIMATSLAQIADVTWKLDEDYARGLFSFAVNKVSPSVDDTTKDASAKSSVRRKINSLIARHDVAWAKSLIEAGSKDLKGKAAEGIMTAQDMLETDPGAAAELAEQSIQAEINQAQVSILRRLRKDNPDEADRLYQQILARCARQPDMDANVFAITGTYLFRSDRVIPGAEDGITFIRVGNIGMPNMMATIPGIPPALIQSYLRTAIVIMGRPTPVAEQRQIKYALGYMMVPKAQEFAPSLVPELVAAMASLSSQVPADYTSGDAYKYLNKKEGTPEDRINEIEKTPDSAARDQLYLDMAFGGLRRGNLETARLAETKIGDTELKNQLDDIIKFAEIQIALKGKEPNIAELSHQTDKLPENLDKAMLRLGLAAVAEKAKNRDAMLENLGLARDTAVRVADERCPFLLLYIAGQLKSDGDLLAGQVLAEATKAFNKFENIKDPEFFHQVGLEMLRLRYPLDVPGVKIGFQESFFKAINGTDENSVYAISDLTDERLKGLAYVALAKFFVDRKLPPPPKAESKVRIIEEGLLRKAAVTAPVPVYPKEALTKKIAGKTVAEIEYNEKGEITDLTVIESPDPSIAKSVSETLKKWKFAESKFDAGITAQRGKVTFIFTTDRAGKGEVKSPAVVNTNPK